jgi:hypothetical protein
MYFRNNDLKCSTTEMQFHTGQRWQVVAVKLNLNDKIENLADFNISIYSDSYIPEIKSLINILGTTIFLEE